MKNLKPFSAISSEQWYTDLDKSEQGKVQTQYLQYKYRYEDFQKQIFSSKNRAPNEKEWELFNKVTSTPAGLNSIEEKGLEDTPISPDDLVGAGAVKWFGKQMAKTLPVSTLAKISKQGGWIGSARSPAADTLALRKAEQMDILGKTRAEIKQETGWYKVADQWRYTDPSFVDDLAKTGGAYITGEGKLGEVLRTPSFYKHFGTQTTEMIKKKRVRVDPTLSPGEAAYSAYGVDLSQAGLREASHTPMTNYTFPHEVGGHAMRNYQGLEGGYNVKSAKEAIQFMRKEQKLPPLPDSKLQSQAYSMYYHQAGEVDARAVEELHAYAGDLLRAKVSPEEVKKRVMAIDPMDLVKNRAAKDKIPFDENKIWSNRNPQSAKAFSRSEKPTKTLKDLYKREYKKVIENEPKLKIKLTEEEKKKFPERYKNQAM